MNIDAYTLSLLLVFIGLVLIALEPVIPGMFVSVIGVFMVVVGTIGYFYPDTIFSPASLVIALLIASVTAVGVMYAYQKIGGTQEPQLMVASSLVGKTGIVRVKIIPHSMDGKVEIENTMWSAMADHEIPAGTIVKVIKSEGVHVVVTETEK